MRTVCEANKCTGCMACIDSCSKNAIQIQDSLNSYNAVINTELCVSCGKCEKICQNNFPVALQKPQKWLQGWSKDEKIRQGGASGGVAMALAQTFIKAGGTVCSCTFENGKFGFSVIEDVNDLNRFAGSKYVKSNPIGCYKKISELLQNKKKVLFIGLPCQVAAVRKYVGKKMEANLYTVDLICHGTPSPKILDIFLKQYGKELSKAKDIRFRAKGRFQIVYNGNTVIRQGVCDRYMIAFLNSLIYTENCYECKYATRMRVSDITLGDSWGSDITGSEWTRGVSLVLIQSDRGIELINKSNLHLEAVDIEKAVQNNHQLSHPSLKPKGWGAFYNKLRSGKEFNSLVLKYFYKECIKQEMKNVLIALKRTLK